MIEETGVTAITAAREELDAQIQMALDKVAVLRKKREALNMALEVLRQPDDEFELRRRITEAEIELELFSIWLAQAFHELVAIDRVLYTSPSIERHGERDQTYYALRKVMQP